MYNNALQQVREDVKCVHYFVASEKSSFFVLVWGKMLEARDTVIVVILITILGYYLQSGPKIGTFLSLSQVKTFSNDGIVVVDNLFTPEELEEISKELMLRVDNRPVDVRAEDLLNLHHNDSYIMGRHIY